MPGDHNDGAFPIERLQAMESEVHHLDQDFREHKLDTRQRLKSLDGTVSTLQTSVVGLSAGLEHLTKTILYVGSGVGAILLAVLSVVLTKLFAGGH